MGLTRITKGVIKPNEDYQTGIITATGLDVNGDADVSGNLSVGGVLTYEDVTSIDSVGIITAQKDIHVGAGVSIVGIVTAATGDFVDLDVDGHTNLDNVSISGVTTIGDVVVGGATTDLIVNGDARVTGILSVGTGTVVIDETTVKTGTSNLHSIGIEIAGINVLGADTPIGSGSTIYNSGAAVFTGIVTATGADINGDLDVDGHTNLDNVSIAGVVTATSFATDGGHMYITNAMPALYFTDTNNNPDWRIQNVNGTLSFIDATNSVHRIEINTVGNVSFSNDLDVDGHTNLDNVSIAGVSTFTGNADSYTHLTLPTTQNE